MIDMRADDLLVKNHVYHNYKHLPIKVDKFYKYRLICFCGCMVSK